MQRRAVALDQFGQPFYFRLPDGRKDKRTLPGLCFTIFVSIAIVFYASVQFVKLVSFGDNTIMVSSRDTYFPTEFEFTSDDGLMIAFGLTAYDENYESIEDDDYGTLKAFYKTWGMADAPGVEFTEIPS